MHTVYLGNSENVPNNEKKKKNEKTYILYTPKKNQFSEIVAKPQIIRNLTVSFHFHQLQSKKNLNEQEVGDYFNNVDNEGQINQ